MSPGLREQLAKHLPELAAAAMRAEEEMQRVFAADGSMHPPHNYLRVADTFSKFKSDFLPQSPLIDPLGNRIKVRLFNFPKFLNLEVKPGFTPKRPHTIVEHLEAGTFVEEEYELEQDRIQALFWIPDVIRDPDAIYPKDKNHGFIPADHIYVKVYNTDGSPVKVVFTQNVGKYKETVIVTSYLTSRTTARKYVGGSSIYRRA